MTLIVDPCPICGSVEFLTLYTSNIPKSDDPIKYFSSSRKKAGHHSIVKCLNCGLVMSNPRDNPDTLEYVYSRLDDPLYAYEEENRQRTARRYLRLVREFVPSPQHLLDVGCSTGIFLKLAQELAANTTGIEPSVWAAQAARQRSPKSDVICEMLEQVSISPGSFDVITLWDVLEHVRNPGETLDQLHKWLKPGGMLFLNLPDVESWVSKVMRKYWVLYLREHLWYFSPTTIEKLLSNSNFEIVFYRPNFVWFSMSVIFKRLSQYRHPLAIRAGELARIKVLKRAAVKFPIGEMNVVARKRS